MRPLRVLCDVDGVLADFGGMARSYAAKHIPHVALSTVDTCQSTDLLGVPGLRECMKGDPAIAKWCRDMPAFPEAKAFWDALVAHPHVGVVHVATVPFCAAWLSARAEWLERFGIPLKQQHHTHVKEALAGGGAGWDVLIDDNAATCNAFTNAGGQAFMIARAYNSAVGSGVITQRGDYAACLRWLSSL